MNNSNRKSMLLQVITLISMIFLFTSFAKADEASDPQVVISEVSQTLMQMRLQKGVSIETAVKAMISKAGKLNLKLIARHSISKELNKRGIKTPYLEMFQFCNMENAGELVSKNRIYAAYIPCQISITDNGKGETWLMMRNMDMTIDNVMIPPELAEIAIRINQGMLAIITAGATGKM